MKTLVDYFKEKVENENTDSKSLWNALKELGMPSKKVILHKVQLV